MSYESDDEASANPSIDISPRFDFSPRIETARLDSSRLDVESSKTLSPKIQRVNPGKAWGGLEIDENKLDITHDQIELENAITIKENELLQLNAKNSSTTSSSSSISRITRAQRRGYNLSTNQVWNDAKLTSSSNTSNLPLKRDIIYEDDENFNTEHDHTEQDNNNDNIDDPLDSTIIIEDNDSHKYPSTVWNQTDTNTTKKIQKDFIKPTDISPLNYKDNNKRYSVDKSGVNTTKDIHTRGSRSYTDFTINGSDNEDNADHKYYENTSNISPDKKSSNQKAKNITKKKNMKKAKNDLEMTELDENNTDFLDNNNDNDNDNKDKNVSPHKGHHTRKKTDADAKNDKDDADNDENDDDVISDIDLESDIDDNDDNSSDEDDDDDDDDDDDAEDDDESDSEEEEDNHKNQSNNKDNNQDELIRKKSHRITKNNLFDNMDNNNTTTENTNDTTSTTQPLSSDINSHSNVSKLSLNPNHKDVESKDQPNNDISRGINMNTTINTNPSLNNRKSSADNNLESPRHYPLNINLENYPSLQELDIDLSLVNSLQGRINIKCIEGEDIYPDINKKSSEYIRLDPYITMKLMSIDDYQYQLGGRVDISQKSRLTYIPIHQTDNDIQQQQIRKSSINKKDGDLNSIEDEEKFNPNIWKKTLKKRKQTKNPKFDNEIIQLYLTDIQSYILTQITDINGNNSTTTTTTMMNTKTASEKEKNILQNMIVLIEIWHASTLRDICIGQAGLSILPFLIHPYETVIQTVPLFFPGSDNISNGKLRLEILFEQVYKGYYTLSLYKLMNLRIDPTLKVTQVCIQCSLGNTVVKQSKIITIPPNSAPEKIIQLFNGLIPSEDIILNSMDNNCWKYTMKLIVINVSTQNNVTTNSDDQPTNIPYDIQNILSEVFIDLIPYMNIKVYNNNTNSTDIIKEECFHMSIYNEFIDQKLPAGDVYLQVRYLRAGILTCSIDNGKNIILPSDIALARDSYKSIQIYVKLILPGQGFTDIVNTTKQKLVQIPIWDEQFIMYIIDQYTINMEVYIQIEQDADSDDLYIEKYMHKLIGFSQISLLSIFERGYFSEYIPIKIQKPGGKMMRETGSILIHFTFSALSGVKFPQHTVNVPIYDDKYRKKVDINSFRTQYMKKEMKTITDKKDISTPVKATSSDVQGLEQTSQTPSSITNNAIDQPPIHTIYEKQGVVTDESVLTRIPSIQQQAQSTSTTAISPQALLQTETTPQADVLDDKRFMTPDMMSKTDLQQRTGMLSRHDTRTNLSAESNDLTPSDQAFIQKPLPLPQMPPLQLYSNSSTQPETQSTEQEYTDEEILAAFKFIDLDNNNYVGVKEIKHILICMGELITDEEVDMMITMVDTDGDGMVSFDEFRMLVLHPNLADETVNIREESMMSKKSIKLLPSIINIPKESQKVTMIPQQQLQAQQPPLTSLYAASSQKTLQMKSSMYSIQPETRKDSSASSDYQSQTTSFYTNNNTNTYNNTLGNTDDLNKENDGKIVYSLEDLAKQRQIEMKLRENKKKYLISFVTQNEISFEKIKLYYQLYNELAYEDKYHSRINYKYFCSCLVIEHMTEYYELFQLFLPEFYNTNTTTNTTNMTENSALTSRTGTTTQGGGGGGGGQSTISYLDTIEERIDFRQFLLSLMNFIIVPKETRIRFCFLMYDEKKTGLITLPEIEEILCGNHMVNLLTVKRKAETIMKQAIHDNTSTGITMNELVIVARKFPNILLPTFHTK